jgi:hypothetical protein
MYSSFIQLSCHAYIAWLTCHDIVGRITMLFEVTFNAIAIRNITRVLLAFPIGGGVGGSQNWGGEAVGDGGCRGEVGDDGDTSVSETGDDGDSGCTVEVGCGGDGGRDVGGEDENEQREGRGRSTGGQDGQYPHQSKHKEMTDQQPPRHEGRGGSCLPPARGCGQGQVAGRVEGVVPLRR